MKYLFLSDMHLGNPLFKFKDQIYTLINSGSFDKLILVGDIIDTWEDDYKDIQRKNKSLIDSINLISIEVPTIFIKGNHDPDNNEDIKYLFPYVSIQESHVFDDGIVTHGSQFDKLIIKHDKLARILYVFSWITERLFNFSISMKLYKLFHSLSNKKHKSYYDILVSDVAAEAIKEYKNKYKFVLMGHTHMPAMYLDEGFRYINCGDLLQTGSYVTYNSDESNFKLHYF